MLKLRPAKERPATIDEHRSTLIEAIEMAENRLECALMGDIVSRGCVEGGRSYLQPFVTNKE